MKIEDNLTCGFEIKKEGYETILSSRPMKVKTKNNLPGTRRCKRKKPLSLFDVTKHLLSRSASVPLGEIKEETETELEDKHAIAATKKPFTWIGINGEHEHVHDGPGPAGPAASPKTRDRCLSRTPHIIVSPDSSEGNHFFRFPDPLEGSESEKEKENSIQTEKFANNAGRRQTPGLQAQHSIDEDRDELRKVSVDPNGNKEKSNRYRDSQDHRGSIQSQEFQNMNEDTSSSDNTPTDDRGQPYYNDSAPEDQIQQEFSSRNAQRFDNKNYRSMSATSLDPNDPFRRKTRRNSMIGILHRVSSQNSLSMNQPNLPPQIGSSNSRISLMTNNNDWRAEMNESLILSVSALYAKLLVVMGMAFPIAEIISDDVPLIFYNSFYLYLYFGSILFLIYAYLFLLRAKSFTNEAFKNQVQIIREKMPRFEVDWEQSTFSKPFRHFLTQKKKEPDGRSERDERISVGTSIHKPPKYTITESSNSGSMYLKMGAVIFGIGSMIYSGLEFGQFFELRSDEGCANILMAISPVARMIFTFLQMYFIFLNSRVAINKHTIIARFGFMHMIGTNLCIWLNVLVQETKHEIAHLTHSAGEHQADLYPGHSVTSHHDDVIENDTMHLNHSLGATHESHDIHHHNVSLEIVHKDVRRSADADQLSGCRRINLMGNVVNSASPFLFPCTIEYSLLCAGVLYVMWKNINVSKSEKTAADGGDSDISTFIARKVRHHYSVDCARASRGLFMGIFILVLTIISLILFYVLISNEQFRRFAILEANIIEVSIYSVAIISVVVGMKQMRELEFILEGDIELDNILLIIAQAGVYIYTSFTIIGGYFSLEARQTLPLLTAILTLIQTTLQTLFILDGSRRCCYTADQLDRKPGREMVTFLLVCNLAMWAISTFETSRADVHPTQLHFYGIWAWTIISHVSMPLAIFYRFHVTVCLGEIWKRSYKLKNDFMVL